MGTEPEYYVYQALTRLGVDFDYQSSKMGGRQERGGAILDFFIPGLNLAINVASLYWHYTRPAQLQNDMIQREMLESQGIRVIYIDEDDARRNAKWYVEEALAGRDHSRMRR
jgi:hypothetical protein